MGKTKSTKYNKFMKEGVIETLHAEDIELILKRVDGIHKRYIKEGRALVILLYYTGCRPAEALEIKARDVFKYNNRLLGIKLTAKKRGLPRTVLLRLTYPLVKEFYKYAKLHFDEVLLFQHYASKYTRTVMNKKTGEIYTRIDTTDKLRYHFKRWFKGLLGDELTPYYLRHNRFSLLAEGGATDRDLRQLKGARSDVSIFPYLHMSKKSAVEMAKMIK